MVGSVHVVCCWRKITAKGILVFAKVNFLVTTKAMKFQLPHIVQEKWIALRLFEWAILLKLTTPETIKIKAFYLRSFLFLSPFWSTLLYLLWHCSGCSKIIRDLEPFWLDPVLWVICYNLVKVWWICRENVITRLNRNCQKIKNHLKSLRWGLKLDYLDIKDYSTATARVDSIALYRLWKRKIGMNIYIYCCYCDLLWQIGPLSHLPFKCISFQFHAWTRWLTLPVGIDAR